MLGLGSIAQGAIVAVPGSGAVVFTMAANTA
jgi:hypothetical protein